MKTNYTIFYQHQGKRRGVELNALVFQLMLNLNHIYLILNTYFQSPVLV